MVGIEEMREVPMCSNVAFQHLSAAWVLECGKIIPQAIDADRRQQACRIASHWAQEPRKSMENDHLTFLFLMRNG